jgi:hypothetical protein
LQKTEKGCRTKCGSPFLIIGDPLFSQERRRIRYRLNYGFFSGAILMPVTPPAFNGFTLPSFDPFFTGVFFIFVLSLELDLPSWATLNCIAYGMPNLTFLGRAL